MAKRRSRGLGRAWADLPLRTKGLIVVAIPVAALVVATLLFGVALREERQAQGLVLRTVEVERQLAQVRVLIQTGVGGYLLTGEEPYLDAYKAASRDLPSSLARLRAVVEDNPTQVATLQRVTDLASRRQEILTALIASVRAGQPPQRRAALLDRSKQTSDALIGQLNAMQSGQQRLLAGRQARARRTRTLALEAIGLSVLLGLGGGVIAMLLFTSGVTRRVRQLECDAGRLAEGQPLSPTPLGGSDEVGRLGRGLARASVLLGERESALREAKLTAEQANQAKSEFLSRMSHELRTPLNAIVGFSQLLELDELADEQHDSLRHILSGARHLLALINEVLDIAAIEAGRLHMSLEPVAVADVMDEAVSLIRPLADQHNVLLVAPKQLPAAHVLGDRQRLKQVLLNLLSNAVKYNRAGGSARLACEEVPDGRLRIKVTDTGPGIAPESIDRLFVPFERLESKRSNVEGTGLGLPLSKRLTEAMGGTLELATTPGQGSTFWVELPVAERPVERAERQQQLGPLVQEQADPARPALTVLYIEDNLSNLQLVEQVLSRRPTVQLISAMRPQLGLDLASQHHPDLVLLDLHLPDIPGEEVLQRLRTSPTTAHVPVAVVSADARPDLISRLLDQGARAFLTKPLDVKELLELLDAIAAEREQAAASSRSA